MKPTKEEKIDRPGENETIKEREVSGCSKSTYNNSIVRRLRQL